MQCLIPIAHSTSYIFTFSSKSISQTKMFFFNFLVLLKYAWLATTLYRMGQNQKPLMQLNDNNPKYLLCRKEQQQLFATFWHLKHYTSFETSMHFCTFAFGLWNNPLSIAPLAHPAHFERTNRYILMASTGNIGVSVLV